VTGSPKFHGIRRKAGFDGKMMLIFGSISCLCNSTTRRGQQDGYQQSAAPKRVLFAPAEEMLEDEKMNPVLLLGWESL
jgi:hypothetical protein